MSSAELSSLVLGPDADVGVVAIHGEASTPSFDFPFLEQLSASHRVVAPFLPGSGRTRPSDAPLQLESLAHDIVAAAAASGLRRFHVVGHSLGAALAVVVCALHPDRVDRLAMSAGVAQARPTLQLACRMWRRLLDADPLLQGEFRLWLGSSENQRNEEAAALANEGVLTAASTPQFSGAQIDLLGRLDIRPFLHEVRAPTLAVVPMHDRLLAPEDGRFLAQALADGRYEPVQCGHDIGAEAPETWWRLLRQHLMLPR